jgi:hypothetical protein
MDRYSVVEKKVKEKVKNKIKYEEDKDEKEKSRCINNWYHIIEKKIDLKKDCNIIITK